MENIRDSYLTWLKRQEKYSEGNFGCCYEPMKFKQTWIENIKVSYYEIMEHIVRNPIITDEYVKYLWDEDIKYLQSIADTIKKQVKAKATANKFFITITTDKNRATPDKLLKFIYQLRDKTKWIKDLTAVIENHRENGEILHTHIIIETDESVRYGSKVKDKLWALKSLKEMIGGSNYIDYVNYDERHEKYVRGDKQEAKLDYIAKDRVWREQYNIPHLIEKNKK